MRSSDVIVDSAAGDNISKLLKLATYGSRIVLYGGALGKMGASTHNPFWKQWKSWVSTMAHLMTLSNC